MKRLSLLLCAAVLALSVGGCAGTLKTAADVLDALYTEPTPVCEEGAAGTRWQDAQCMKFSDGSYRWVWRDQ